MSFVVRELTNLDEEAFLKGFKEWEGENLSWYTFEFKFNDKFTDHIERLKKNKAGVDLDPRYVPATMLYGFFDGEIIGRVSIRHELNDYLRTIGGNIGYSVAPRFRRRGFATVMMAKALDYCRQELGLKEVLVTCDDDNLGSIKVIEKFNFRLEDKIGKQDSKVLTRRYLIEI